MIFKGSPKSQKESYFTGELGLGGVLIHRYTGREELSCGNILQITIPSGNYMFKVTNRNTRTRCEISSELSIKTP